MIGAGATVIDRIPIADRVVIEAGSTVVGIPEALTEGETEEEARANARDCLIAAIEGYMKAGKPLPRERAGHSGLDRAVLRHS